MEQKELSFLDVITNLRKLSSLKENEKLIILEDTFEIDMSYIPSISRMFYRNSRVNTSEFIKKLINRALYFSNDFIDKISNIITDYKYLKNNLILITQQLLLSMRGLENLKSTYNTDILFINNIDLTLNIIRIIIENNKNYTKTNINKYID